MNMLTPGFGVAFGLGNASASGTAPLPTPDPNRAIIYLGPPRSVVFRGGLNTAPLNTVEFNQFSPPLSPPLQTPDPDQAIVTLYVPREE